MGKMDHVTIIKLAYGNLYMEKISIKETLIQVISYYYEYYTITKDSKFKQLILDHVQAYLELGFSYEEICEFSDEILKDILGAHQAKKSQFIKRTNQQYSWFLEKSKIKFRKKNRNY